MGGESYFVVEIRSLKRILDALTDTLPTLCVIDEILRGTNTVERIAASAALLRYVQGRNCLVMAATHDQELTHLLKNYSQVHFREELTEQGMPFLLPPYARPGRYPQCHCPAAANGFPGTGASGGGSGSGTQPLP